jgi:hypothetical protein
MKIHTKLAKLNKNQIDDCEDIQRAVKYLIDAGADVNVKI